MFTSFAVTIGASRAINYVRERRRTAPRLRSWARRMYHAPGQEKLRVHHFMPGIALAFLSGTGAILGRNDGREFDPYWASEKLAAAQAAIATTGAVVLGIRFHRHGKRPAEWPAVRRVRLKRTTAAARSGFRGRARYVRGLYEGFARRL